MIVSGVTLAQARLLRPSEPDQRVVRQAEELDQLLQRLGMFELRLTHWERLLDQAVDVDPRTREAWARRLADLYAERLVELESHGNAAAASMLKRIEKLKQEFPSIQSNSLQVILLQARYQRLEARVNQWLDQPARQPAELGRELRDHAAQWLEWVKRLESQLEPWDGTPQAERAETQLGELALSDDSHRRWQNLSGLYRRAQFFCGWSHYYAALVESASADSRELQTASRKLRDFLGLEDEALADLDPQEFNLDSIWHARATLGLAMASAAATRWEDAICCFRWLDEPQTHPDVRDPLAFWKLRAMVLADRPQLALGWVRSQASRQAPPLTTGKVLVLFECLRAARHWPDHRRELLDQALYGLARLERPGLVTQALERYQLSPAEPEHPVLIWERGVALFQQAEDQQDVASYQQALSLFQQAASAIDVSREPVAVARVRYLKAWSHYRLEQFEQAAQSFEKAGQMLQEARHDLAPESLWMAFASWRKLANANDGAWVNASRLLDQIQSDFPGHPYAGQADYQRTRLQGTQSLETLIARLEGVDAGDANYRLARYDLCLLRHRQWKAKRAAQPRLAEPFVAEATRFVTQQPADSRTFRILLLLLEVAPSDARQQEWWDQAQSLRQELSLSAALMGQYQFQQIQRDLREQRLDIAHKRLKAWPDLPRGQWYQQALTRWIVACEQQLGKLSGPGRQDSEQLNSSLLDAYQSLVGTYPDDPELWRSQPNARVAKSRLAHFATECGRHELAAAQLQQLVEAFPDNKGYVRRAAQALFRIKNLEASLELWNRLLAGRSEFDPSWFEAKYHQLRCLHVLRPDAARDVWRQFRLLHPEIQFPEWRAKFDALARTFQ